MSDSKNKKPIPDFATEEDEADFWSTRDTTEYDLGPEVTMDADPGSRTRPISIRLPEWLLAAIREEAGRRRMPYQRLMRDTLEHRFKARVGESAAEPRPPYSAGEPRRELIERCRARLCHGGGSGKKAA